MGTLLTKETVATLALPAGKTQIIYWDDSLPCFGLSVRNHRTFILRYRAGKTQRTVTLGRVNRITLNRARDEAKRLFAEITLGGDPMADKRAARTPSAPKLTFGSAVETYLRMKESEVRPSSFRIMRSYLQSETYFGTLARHDLSHITRQIVAERLAKIREEISDTSAGRARAHLSAFFARAMQEGFAETNPVIGTKGQSERPQRERVLTDDEIGKVWRACKDDDYGRIIRLLILTGCRRQEIGSLRWSEVDLNEGTITIPADRAKNGRTHILPLPQMALDILASIPRRVGRDHVFADRSSTGFVAWGRCKETFNDGITDPWVVHDLRRTFRTGLGKLKVRPDVAERCINHAQDSIVETYDRHRYQQEIAQAMGMWADHVASIVNGDQQKIIPIRREKKIA
jgi:integrase